jgi:hypothetical protein
MLLFNHRILSKFGKTAGFLSQGLARAWPRDCGEVRGGACPPWSHFITKHRVSRSPALIACRFRDGNPLKETPVSNALGKWHEHPQNPLPPTIKHLHHQNNPVIANRKVPWAAEQDQHGARVRTSANLKLLQPQDGEGRGAPGKPVWKVLIAIQVLPQAAEAAQGRRLAQRPELEVHPVPSNCLVLFTDFHV